MTFRLQIVTPDGLAFEGEAEKISVRTIEGEIGILARHIDYVSPLGMGEAVITDAEGKERRAACIGGMVAVHNGNVRLVATTFEWAENIDLERAKAAEQRKKSICLMQRQEHWLEDSCGCKVRLKTKIFRGCTTN